VRNAHRADKISATFKGVITCVSLQRRLIEAKKRLPHRLLIRPLSLGGPKLRLTDLKRRTTQQNLETVKRHVPVVRKFGFLPKAFQTQAGQLYCQHHEHAHLLVQLYSSITCLHPPSQTHTRPLAGASFRCSAGCTLTEGRDFASPAGL
jgi:hypothetical protein